MAVPHSYTDLDERDTLPGIVAKRAGAEPDRLYMTDASAPRDEHGNAASLTFGQAHERFLTWADAYRRAGVAPADRVGVMLPNSFDAASAWLGCAWVRGYEVPLNNAFRGYMLRYTLENAGVSLAVVAERFVDRIVEVAGEVPTLRTVVVPDAAGELPEIPGVRVVGRAEFLDGARPAHDLDPPMPWDPSAIVYTSGTTGPSKGVVSPWGMLTLGMVLLDDLGPDDVFYSPFPMFHMSGRGAIAQAAYSRGRMVFREAFDTGSFWSDIDEHGCTFTLVVPAMAHWLLAQPPSPGDRSHALRYALLSPVVPGFAERFGVRVRTHYGMTEAGNVMSRRDVLDASPSCGRPIRGYEVRLVDEHDYEVPVGEVGELVVRTTEPWLLNSGYWGMPERTAEAWRNGWFHTGDGFRRDAEGNYFFVDRQKDALRRRGENVSSFEVEAVVLTHPDVAECAAIGVDAGLGEQEIKICVVGRDGATVDPAALIEYLVPKLPRFMVPRYVEQYGALPKTEATMRVQKAKLREAPFTEATWDRDAAGITVPKD
ncbi:MAG TPA: AMP-binding protein [Acidimicrobiia bacterium]|nr:AMP-binding protein [Acidimicrobiia bacterium]